MSRPYVRTSSDPMDPNRRLVLENDDGLITISDEDTTSASASAQTTNVRGAVDMTPEEARWLYFALGDLLRSHARKSCDERAILGVDDEEANVITAELKQRTNAFHRWQKERLLHKRSNRTPLTEHKIGGDK